MRAGKYCKRENYKIDTGQVISRPEGYASGKTNCRNSKDLDSGVYFTEEGGTEPAKTGNYIDCCRSHHYEDITTNDRDRYPKRNRQVRRQRLGKYGPHG